MQKICIWLLAQHSTVINTKQNTLMVYNFLWNILLPRYGRFWRDGLFELDWFRDRRQLNSLLQRQMMCVDSDKMVVDNDRWSVCWQMCNLLAVAGLVLERRLPLWDTWTATGGYMLLRSRGRIPRTRCLVPSASAVTIRLFQTRFDSIHLQKIVIRFEFSL